jgi:thiamine-phosphate pyrophosphorylase
MLARFYAILDAELLGRRGIAVGDAAMAMRDAGVKLVQYRDKQAGARQILRNAAIIQKIFEGTGCTLVLDDRADLALLAGWDGVHVGQHDLSPEGALAVMGAGALVGLSTHNEAQVREGEASGAGYLAIGPVFETASKLNPEPVVGLEGVRAARALTRKPLVAIGGITLANAAEVLAAGADAVAVISAAIGMDAAETRTRCAEWVISLRG